MGEEERRDPKDGSEPGAFVSSFEYDVFLSYAHVDNVIPANARPEAGWVYTLKDNLERLLPHKLGRKSKARIWVDRRLPGNAPFPTEIRDAVRSSATLLVVMSGNYLASDWCQQEREHFLEAANDTGGHEGRVFVVRQTDVGHESWPEPFRTNLGYKFYAKEYDDDPARTLGWPVADPANSDDRPYFQRVDDLTREFAAELNRIEEAQPARALPDDAPRVFLAETTPDLNELRDSVRRHLEGERIVVQPRTYYERTPDAYRQAMERDLVDCRVFVQLLGPYTTTKSTDLPKGYEGLQLDVARGRGVAVLRWHETGLDLEKVQDIDLIKREPVEVTEFEDFKRAVVAQARRSISPAPPANGNPYALIEAERQDDGVAKEAFSELQSHHFGPDVIGEKDSLPELAKGGRLDVHGVLVIYGKCDLDWVRKRVRECRVVMLELKERAPICGVYIASSPDKPPLLTCPPNIHVFSDFSAPEFTRYVDAVRERAGQ